MYLIAFSRSALAVWSSWRTGIDGHGVVLGHPHERGLDAVGAGNQDRGHPIHPPAPGVTPQPEKDLVDPSDQVRLVHPRGELGAEPARVREHPHQYVDLLPPGGVAKFQPVPLDLLTRRMLYLGGRLSLYPLAGAAVRAQRPIAQLADEGRVALRVAQLLGFVVERGSPEMGIVVKALAQVGFELLEAVLSGPATLTDLAFSLQMGPHRLAVAAQMAGNGRYRPAPFVLVALISTNSSCGNIGAGLLSRPLFCTYAAWIAGPAC